MRVIKTGNCEQRNGGVIQSCGAEILNFVRLKWVKSARVGLGAAAPHVRFAPIATDLVRGSGLPLCAKTGREQVQQTASSRTPLFDHLVGEREQVIGDFDAKLLRSLQIDEKLKLGRL